MMVSKTWNEFWGPLLLWRFHENNPQRWTIRKKRAGWILSKADLAAGSRILDVGCGDGLLDICLARLGAEVTAVDRVSSVLELAEKEPDADRVKFRSGDIRRMDFPDESFDLVLMMELVGLMSRDDDAGLFEKVRRWLSPGGRLLVDCPREPAKEKTSFKQEFPDGILEIESGYEAQTRRQSMIPRFHKKTGEIVELRDSYDDTIPDQTGVLRYIYPVKELIRLLERNNLEVKELEHYVPGGFRLFMARKNI